MQIELTREEEAAVQSGVCSLLLTLKKYGQNIVLDDRAGQLTTAIRRYVQECKEDANGDNNRTESGLAGLLPAGR